MGWREAGFSLNNILMVIVAVIAGIFLLMPGERQSVQDNNPQQVFASQNQSVFTTFKHNVDRVMMDAKRKQLSPTGVIVRHNKRIKLWNHWPECVVELPNRPSCTDDEVPNNGTLTTIECRQLFTALTQQKPVLHKVYASDANHFTCQFRMRQAPTIGFDYQPLQGVLKVVSG